jgi:hypothetical protein
MKVVIFVARKDADDFPELKNAPASCYEDLLALKESDDDAFYKKRIDDFVTGTGDEVIRIHHDSGTEELNRQKSVYPWTRSIIYSRRGEMEQPFKMACKVFEEKNLGPLLAYIRGNMDRERAIGILWNMALAFREIANLEEIERLFEDIDDVASKIVGTDQKGKAAKDYVEAYSKCVLKRFSEARIAVSEENLNELNSCAKKIYSEYRIHVQDMLNHPT